MSSDIVERLRRWDDGRISTHYEGCIDTHPVCAILWAARIIEERDADLAAERAISDELFACTYASLESGRLERARAAWQEARREQ